MSEDLYAFLHPIKPEEITEEIVVSERFKDKDGNVIAEIHKNEIYEMIHDGSISGGMIPKVLGCLESIDGGVTGAHIIDGRIPHCLLLEIFTKTGIGTLIKSDKY